MPVTSQDLKTNPKHAEYINRLIMNRHPDINPGAGPYSGTQDRAAHTEPAPFDDHALGQIVVSAQKEVSRMANAHRDYRATIKLIGKLPYEEQQQAWKMLDQTVTKGDRRTRRSSKAQNGPPEQVPGETLRRG